MLSFLLLRLLQFRLVLRSISAKEGNLRAVRHFETVRSGPSEHQSFAKLVLDRSVSRAYTEVCTLAFPHGIVPRAGSPTRALFMLLLHNNRR